MYPTEKMMKSDKQVFTAQLVVSAILAYLDILQLIRSSDPFQSRQIAFEFQLETFLQLFHLIEAFEDSVAVHSDRELEVTHHAFQMFLHWKQFASGEQLRS